MKIESVQIEFDESAAGIGPGRYKLLSGRSKVDLEFWWTTQTNYGELKGKKCIVVAQTRNIETKAFVKGAANFPTDACSWEGWLAIQVPVGSYQVTVRVEEPSSGATRTGIANITVIG